VAYRSISSNQGNTTPANFSITTSVPAGVQDNDILLLVFTIDLVSGTVTSWPAGFTQIYFTTVPAPPGDGQAMGVAWKRASGESGTYTISMGNGSGSQDWLCQCVAFSGRVTSGSPVTASSNSIQNTPQSSPVSIDASTITAATGDDLCWISLPDVTATGIGNGHTAPTNFTERSDQEDTLGGWSNLSVATRNNVSAGATGTVSGQFALTSGTAAWRAFLIALAASGGTVGDGARLSNVLVQPMLRGPY
jgi:hypothetical protein